MPAAISASTAKPGCRSPGGDEAVEPLGIDAAAPVVVGGEHVEQEALVGRAARDHEVEVRERAEQARARFLARVAGRDHLRDQRIEGRRDGAARGDAGVDAHARPERRIETRDPAGRRQEARIRVLGAHARLDRKALLAQREQRERFAARDADLELDEVDARRATR